MKPRNLMSLCAAAAFAALLGGCYARDKGAAEPGATPVVAEPSAPADPMAAWTWKIPAPPAPPMVWVPAKNFSKGERTPESVNAIAIHTTEGGYNNELSFEENHNRTFVGNVRYLAENDRRVSAHYVTGRNGEIAWMVNETDAAHTTTYYNQISFGIENAGWGRYAEMWTPGQLGALVNLCAYLCVKWQIPAYQPEGTAYEGPWSTFTDEGLCRFTGQGLVGHYQVQPWNKSDPGPHFPWEEFGERVRARIREYGCEPIPLPAGRPPLPAEWTVTAEAPENVKAREPFTYKFIVEGPGAAELGADAVRFPRYGGESFVGFTTGERNVVLVGEPVRSASSDNRLEYELTLTATGRRGTIIPPKVKIGDHWYDSGTRRVTIEAVEEPPPAAPTTGE